MMADHDDEMSQILNPETRVDDIIVVDVELFCVHEGVYRTTGHYPCRASIREITGCRYSEGYCVEFEILDEHPLLEDERIGYSIAGAVYEMHNMDLGDDYHVSEHCPALWILYGSGKAKKPRRRTERNLSAYEEALLDPAIAARVLTTGEGTHTRNRFYPAPGVS